MLCLFLDDLLGRFIPRRDAELYSPGAQVMIKVARTIAASQLNTEVRHIGDVPADDGGA